MLELPKIEEVPFETDALVFTLVPNDNCLVTACKAVVPKIDLDDIGFAPTLVTAVPKID